VLKKASLKIAILTIALALIIAIVVGAPNLANPESGPSNPQPSNPESETGSNPDVIPGVFVIPELPWGTLMAMVASFGAMVVLATKRLQPKH